MVFRSVRNGADGPSRYRRSELPFASLSIAWIGWPPATHRGTPACGSDVRPREVVGG